MSKMEEENERFKELMADLNIDLQRQSEADAKREARIVVGLVVASAVISGLAVVGLVTIIVAAVRIATGQVAL